MSVELQTVLVSSVFSVVIALITAVVGSFLYVRQAKQDLQREYEQRFNERRWESYTRFGDLFTKLLIDSKGKKVNADELAK